MAWYVSLENRIGQITWSSYPSQEAFNARYAGNMKDGTDDPLKEVYPTIHYQGEDMEECKRINNTKARASYARPEYPLIHALAEAGNMDTAIHIHELMQRTRQ
ncbi:MAG: hypothetical protein V1725_04555 [archaeon]